MNKPILAALGSFVGFCGGTLLVTHFKYDNIDWGRGIATGVGGALCMYIVAQWKLGQEQKKQQESDKTPSN